jgi:hypothetical protein
MAHGHVTYMRMLLRAAELMAPILWSFRCCEEADSLVGELRGLDETCARERLAEAMGVFGAA